MFVSARCDDSAAAGRSSLARYSAEFAGDESEHWVLGQSLAGATPRNNVRFEVFEFSSVKAIKGALLGADFGLRHQGTAAERRPPDLGESRRASPPTQVGRPEPTVPVIRNRNPILPKELATRLSKSG